MLCSQLQPTKIQQIYIHVHVSEAQRPFYWDERLFVVSVRYFLSLIANSQCLPLLLATILVIVSTPTNFVVEHYLAADEHAVSPNIILYSL